MGEKSESGGGSGRHESRHSKPTQEPRDEHTFQCNSRHPIGAEKPTCDCGAVYQRPWHVGGWGEIWTDDGTKVSQGDAGALRALVVEMHNRMLEGGK